MGVDRSHIGVESEDRFLDVEAGQLRLFALATGEADPIYTDAEAARGAGLPARPVPPTFAFSLNLLAPARRGSVLDMGVNIGSVLHGEQSFQYHAPIYIGDRVRLRTKTVDIYEKKGGALVFIVQETSVHNQNDDLCVTSRMVLVVRN
jgi:acyl dehydratase